MAISTAITTGDYLIFCVTNGDVLFTADGSKSKNAKIAHGPLSEPDDRVHWGVFLHTSSQLADNYYYFKNREAGDNGYLATNGAATKAVQYNNTSDYLYWYLWETGNTITINGYTYDTYKLQPMHYAERFLTVDPNADYATVAERNTDGSQEFAFVPASCLDTALGKCGKPTTSNEDRTIVDAASFTPMWEYSKTTLKTAQIRYRYRQQDMDGVWGNWSDWMKPSNGSKAALGWQNITGTAQKKEDKNFIVSPYDIPTVLPDYTNSVATQMHVQVRARKSSNNTHGVTAGSTEFMVYRSPTFALEDVMLSPSGLAVRISTDYAAEGMGVTITSIVDETKGLTILKNYELNTLLAYNSETELYEDTIQIPANELYDMPDSGDTLNIKAQLHMTISQLQATATASLSVSYESGSGLTINPTYVLSDRLTYLASIASYAITECWIRVDNIDGTYTLQACEKISDDGVTTVFEIPAAFNEASHVLWVCMDDSNNWTSEFRELPAIVTDCCAWYWSGEDGPGAAIMRYRAGAIIQPGDTIKTQAEKFITTGRQYPAWRFGASLERTLDIEGAIVDDETETYYKKQRFVELADAHHAVFRTPDGAWYNAAITGVRFERENGFTVFSVTQEAESL